MIEGIGIMGNLIKSTVIMCSLLLVGPAFDGVTNIEFFIKDVEARIGRPLTPVSVAGVGRRTTRRAIRRSAVYVAALPIGYTTVVVSGTTLYKSGNTYYQADGTQYVIVEVE